MSIGRYKSKLVEIEAVQFLPENYNDLSVLAQTSTRGHGFQCLTLEEVSSMFPGAEIGEELSETKIYAVIPTLEGPHLAREGDWIIRGTEGEIYPCKPSVFARKYEPV